MKKLFYLLFFNFIIWDYGYTQVFQEDFQTVSPLYGNYTHYGGCPSISFLNRDNVPIDCLANWKTFRGTPEIGTENGNSYVSLSSQNFVGANPYVLTEKVYLNSYKLEPNSNYRLVYYVKANYLNGISGTGDFIVELTFEQMTPYYYAQGERCGYNVEQYNIGRRLETVGIPQNGIPEWEMRTVYFSTENDGQYTLLFSTLSSLYNNDSVQLKVSVDNISLYKEGECESKTVTLQNKTISPLKFNPNPTIEGKRIYAGRAVAGIIPTPFGDVVVKPNGILNLKSTYVINLEDGFIVEEGGIFDAYVDGSCYSGYGTYKDAGNDEVGEDIINENNVEVLNKIVMHPNPSNGLFTIRSMTGIDEVVIYNSLGQEINGIIDSKNKSLVEIDLTNKVKGVYLLRIRSGNEWTDKKIIIE